MNEDFKNMDGAAIKSKLIEMESQLDSVMVDLGGMQGFLAQTGFIAPTEQDEEKEYARITSKMEVIAGQVAILYGIIAFEKSVVDFGMSLTATHSSFTALMRAMKTCADDGIPKLQ